ncbi:MAG: winged helix DNA-binding domain-containing protein [Acidobacteria bacterium]|nr:winged helix DNA-binding domain-containing protein [Acidobacteriota bacterium]
MSPQELAAWRMHTQRLWSAPFSKPADVVRWFGAMQAQEYAYAKWAIAQRCRRTGDTQVESSYATGEILRTHVIRPTWHFVHRDDLRWVLDATRHRVHQINGTYYRASGLDEGPFRRSARVLARALRGGNELNRKELTEVLRKETGIDATGIRMAYMLMRAELDGVIVSGSVGGKHPTFAAFADRVPMGTSIPREEAIAELALRYFRSRGPATLRDFVRWSSLTVAEATAGLSSVRSSLKHRDINGRAYYFVARSTPKSPVSPRVDLVQAYDECIMSYSESKDVLRPDLTTRRVPNLNVYLHAVLLDGRLVGHWKAVRGARSLIVEAALYRALNTAERAAMDAATARLGRAFGVEARWMVVTTPTRESRRTP